MRDFWGGFALRVPQKKTTDRKNLLLAVNEAVLSVGMCGERAGNDTVGLFLKSGFGWNKLGKSQGIPKYPQQLGLTGTIGVTKGGFSETQTLRVF